MPPNQEHIRRNDSEINHKIDFTFNKANQTEHLSQLNEDMVFEHLVKSNPPQGAMNHASSRKGLRKILNLKKRR
jgi:hypothetical protein